MEYEHVMDFVNSSGFQIQKVVEMSGILLLQVKERV